MDQKMKKIKSKMDQKMSALKMNERISLKGSETFSSVKYVTYKP
jgi:hypothetical protein